MSTRALAGRRLDWQSGVLEARGRLEEVRRASGPASALGPWCALLERETGYRVSPNTVRRYELGDTTVTLDYLLAVCTARGVAPTWILTGTGSRAWLASEKVREVYAEIERLAHGLHSGVLPAGEPDDAPDEAPRAHWKPLG